MNAADTVRVAVLVRATLDAADFAACRQVRSQRRARDEAFTGDELLGIRRRGAEGAHGLEGGRGCAALGLELARHLGLGLGLGLGRRCTASRQGKECGADIENSAPHSSAYCIENGPVCT